jgi:thioesterase domain-containing protein/acyl carrier protein
MDDDKPIRPSSELRPWLQARLSGLIQRKQTGIPLDEDFHVLGLDSVGYLNLAISIEEELDIPITAKDIFLHSTIELLADFLVNAKPNLKSSPQRLPRGSADYTTVNVGTHLAPLFWLNGYEFLELSQASIPPERPIYYLHHQGSDGKPARHHTIEAMADYYLETILHVEPNGPYCIGGYSIGGPLAHEIANRLLAQGKEVETLMLLSPAGNPKRSLETYLRHHREIAASKSAMQRMLYMARKYCRLYQRSASNNVRRLWRRLRCSPYFLFQRPLPSRLIWRHVQPIYERALNNYAISRYRGDTIIVHEIAISVAEWCEMADGACRVLPPIPIKHLELLEKEHAHLWLTEFLEPLGTGNKGRK